MVDLRLTETLPQEETALYICGTPTYGEGDMHFLWHEFVRSVACQMDRSLPVLLFGLGDRRFHAKTYCMGVQRLEESLGRHLGRSFMPEQILRLDYRLDRFDRHCLIARWLSEGLRGRSDSA